MRMRVRPRFAHCKPKQGTSCGVCWSELRLAVIWFVQTTAQWYLSAYESKALTRRRMSRARSVKSVYRRNMAATESMMISPMLCSCSSSGKRLLTQFKSGFCNQHKIRNGNTFNSRSLHFRTDALWRCCPENSAVPPDNVPQMLCKSATDDGMETYPLYKWTPRLCPNLLALEAIGLPKKAEAEVVSCQRRDATDFSNATSYNTAASAAI